MQKNESRKHKIIVQIFTGGYLEEKDFYPQIESVLTPLLQENKIDKIIIGWSLEKNVYVRTLDLAKKYHVECYLWLPVFSETGILKPVFPVKNRNGRSEKKYHLQEGENFEFYCPSDTENLEKFIQIYEEYYKDLPFQGVFLDKIRYGSFANGIESICTCFCDKCRDTYIKNQINVKELAEEISKLIDGGIEYKRSPFTVKSYKNGEYEFQRSIWKDFFHIKQIIVKDAVTRLADYFHKMGLKVGLDVFAPFLAYFVGQEIKGLSKSADFIKPMMYRITQAPGGLPFETDCMLRETAGENIKLSRKAFREILGCRSWTDTGFDVEFVKKELEYLCGFGAPVYCGIEVNRIDSVAASAPEYIRENIKILGETGIEGFVLSWNLLSAPKENIQTVFEEDSRYNNMIL